MLNDVHCRCRTGSYHVDVELAAFLAQLAPQLERTIVMLVSDHGLYYAAITAGQTPPD